LNYSDFIIIPFEYSDVSVKSTLVFKNLLGLLESEAERIFIRSKYDKGYKYLNQKEMDIEISKYGTLIESPVYKRNCLQSINTRKLTYEQRYAIKKPFNEIIEQISEALQITL
jgi:chromosome partitioning protein